MTMTQQWVVFAVATPLQHAVADLLRKAEKPYKGHINFYAYIRQLYNNKRKLLLAGLESAGFETLDPEGSFFIMATAKDDQLLKKPRHYEQLIERAGMKIDTQSLDYPSYNLSRNLSINNKVTSIPMAAFLSEKNKLSNKAIRFAFCKGDDELQQAVSMLSTLNKKQ